MRGVLCHFDSLEQLARQLEAADEEQAITLVDPRDLAEGEWVLATIHVGEECTSFAACTVDRGGGLELSFAPRDWEQLFDFAHQGGPPSAPPQDLTSPVSQLPAPQAHVLVVDDDDDVRQMVSSILRRTGYDVSVAGSGEEALDRIRAQPFDLVLLDAMLPGISGTEVCRRLRADPLRADLPVLVLSAHSSAPDVSAALDAGADDFVGKPFRAHELSARMLRLLHRAQGPSSRPAPP